VLQDDAISRIAKAPIRAFAIDADAIDEDATAFYMKHQIEPLVSRSQTLVLPPLGFDSGGQERCEAGLCWWLGTI
jgi:hypothetical protein